MALTSQQVAGASKRRAMLVQVCDELPEVETAPAGEQHLAFRVRKKTFAYYLRDHHGDGRIALCCKSPLTEQGQLVARDPSTFFVPPYLGVKGWIGMRLDGAKLDWKVVTELVRAAYRGVAPKSLVAIMD